MDQNENFAFALPTRNRSKILDFFLEVHVPRLQKYNIAINISDCASDDDTREICFKWQKIYPYIYYSRSETLTRPDENFEKALKMCRSEYALLISDTYELPEDTLEQILKIIDKAEEPYSLIGLNLRKRLKTSSEGIYSNSNHVAREFACMLTCISCNVIHKSLISRINFEKYRYTNFGTLGATLEDFAENEFRFYWAPQANVVTLKHPGPIYKGRGGGVLSVLFHCWPEMINMLPDNYTLETKNILKNKFLMQSGFVSPRTFLALRAHGEITSENAEKHVYNSELFNTKYLKYLFIIILIIPPSVANVLHVTIEWIRRRNYRIRNYFGVYSDED